MLTEVNKKDANENVCLSCYCVTSHKSNYVNHLITTHNELSESCKKNKKRYSCLICDYHTSRKSSYDKHLSTTSHNELTSVNAKVAKGCKKNENETMICDICNNKTYKSRVGLWKHKKTCSLIFSNTNNTNTINNTCGDKSKDEFTSMFNKEVVMVLLKENSDKNMIIKLVTDIVESLQPQHSHL